MASPKIIYTDLSTYSYSLSGANATNATFPLSNLLSYEPTLFWSPTAVPTTTHYLIIDFGSAKNCNFIVIGSYSADAVSVQTAYLEYSDNSAFTSGTGVVGALTRAGSSTLFYKSFTTASKRYWRLYFDVDSTYLKVANIFLDSALAFTTPYEFGYKTDNKKYETTQTTSLDGTIHTSQVFAGRRVNELKFLLQDNTLRTGFQTFISTVRGKMYPFYFSDTDGTTFRYFHLDEDYVPVTTPFYGMNNIDSIRMTEHNVS